MKIYRTIDKVTYNPDTIITIGTFDGVHLGHQAMIKSMIQTANEQDARHLLITFDPHPLKIIGRINENILLLTKTEEKISILESLCLENVLLMPFTKVLSQLTAESFIREVLMKQIGLKGLVVGFNHSLGHDRSGTSDNLLEIGAKNDFFVQIVAPVTINNQIVSSTGIRQALQQGHVDLAQTWLGRPYAILGQIISGMKIGRTLGFPTANLQIPEEKMIPCDGIYAVFIRIGEKKLTGLANIGYSPTIPGKKWGIEIYIDNFTEIIYNKEIEVQFIKRLRNEKKFDSTDELIKQIHADQVHAQKIFAQYIRR